MKHLKKYGEINENIVPQCKIKKVRCLECGEKVCDNTDQLLWHLYNKHFKKSTVNEWEEKILLKKYFGKIG